MFKLDLEIASFNINGKKYSIQETENVDFYIAFSNGIMIKSGTYRQCMNCINELNKDRPTFKYLLSIEEVEDIKFTVNNMTVEECYKVDYECDWFDIANDKALAIASKF